MQPDYRNQNNFQDSLQKDKQVSCPRCKSFNFAKGGKSQNGEQYYRCKDCKKYFLENPKRILSAHVLPKNISPEEMFKLDIWDLRILGLKPHVSTGQYTMNFSNINLIWLKNATKRWLWYRSSRDATATLLQKLRAMVDLAKYIESVNPLAIPEDINRDVIVGWFVHLNGSGKTLNTKAAYITKIRQFFEECQRYDWIDITKSSLIFKEDTINTKRILPRYIPDSVIKQLEENFDALPKPIECIVKVLMATGVRVSEICNLPFDCLRQDSTGAYWINIYQPKMKKQITLPIDKELAFDVLEQQKYILKNLGENFHFLFCQTKHHSAFAAKKGTKVSKHVKPKPLNYFEPISKPIRQDTIRGYLHKLAEEKNIRDDSGKIFPLGICHQFRHTHGTQLINAGVPQHIVQKRLGHSSPEMTMYYAHIHDETMKQEMEKFWDGRVVNITGEMVISENPDLDTAEMQWIKKNMKAQALPNGFCGLPVTQSCPVQGSPCLVCSHFRTTKEHLETHKKQLENTENIIKNATAKGWHRQVETNEPIAQNLRNIIQGLEGEVNNA